MRTYGRTYSNALVFVDSSPTTRTVTARGSAAITTSNFKFGTGAGNFDGTPNSFVMVPGAPFVPAGDFTIDLQVRPTTLAGNAPVIGKTNAAGFGYMIQRTGATYQFFVSSNGTSWDVASGAAIGAATLNTYSHVALVRSGAQYFGYLNGVRSAIVASALLPPSGPEPLVMGARPLFNAELFAGQQDEVRFSNVARWTGASFTPPTAPWVPDANTLLLLHCDAVQARVPTWVEVQTSAAGQDDYVWATTLLQVLQLNLGESPFWANYGLPAGPAVASQVFPDFYVMGTQKQFSQYFASLVVARQPGTTPTYSINITTNQGVKMSATIAQ